MLNITPFRRLIGAIALSAIGNGLVLPFFVVYLHSVRGFSISHAGLLLSWMGLSQILFSPLVGTAVDKFGAVVMLRISLVLGALGFSLLGFAQTSWQVLGVVTICAISQGTLWPAQGSLLAQLSPDRERSFGLQFAFLNLGFGIGGVGAALIISAPTERAFHILYIADGISFLIYLLLIFNLKTPERTEVERQKSAEGSWRQVLQDKRLLRIWIVAFIAILFGYSQLEAGFSSYSIYVAELSPGSLAWAYAANTFVIALMQMRFVKWVRNWRRSRALMLATSLWALSWVVVGSAKWWPTVLVLIFAQLIFAVGEMIWSPVAPALVNDLAPDEMRGRYNALFSGAWQSALILGPGVAGLLIGTGQGFSWVVVVVVGSLFASFLAFRLHSILTPDQERGRMTE
ncbi:MAG: MFS transporter [Actinobacteria bacterium]|uniref:Unannotated protein n=2 Tax=freshwater metagenome TaxID=449393 RepID=A0A6J6UXZ9_9ZZZZ|nr:MFS transporter [Actinomycetota bacterium]MTB14087.1 MFS transporter [Actinomycetota bacterium]